MEAEDKASRLYDFFEHKLFFLFKDKLSFSAIERVEDIVFQSLKGEEDWRRKVVELAEIYEDFLAEMEKVCPDYGEQYLMTLSGDVFRQKEIPFILKHGDVEVVAKILGILAKISLGAES